MSKSLHAPKTSAILIIGAGSFGFALASCVLSEPHCRVVILGRQLDVSKSNAIGQSNARLETQLMSSFDGDLNEYIGIIIAVPCQSVRNVSQWIRRQIDKFPLRKPLPIISTAKGIEQTTTLLPYQILKQELAEPLVSIGALSGPSFAAEMSQGLPSCVVLASPEENLIKTMIPFLHSAFFRVYSSHDIIGVSLCGALKNVIAMAAGAVDGLGLGNNARSALVTRGLGEMAEIGMKMGASPLTFMGLSGVGDLILTCTGDLSRNRQFGFRLAKGEDKEQLTKSLGGVVEGLHTALSAHELLKKVGVKAIILEKVYEVLYEGLSIQGAVNDLLKRQQSAEFNWTTNEFLSK